MKTLEKHDIQGLVARGYGTLAYAQFWLLEVEDAVRARAYLGQLDVTNAESQPEGAHRATAIHVAFTWPGLVALGVPVEARETFARELTEGMDDPVRAAALGDERDNAPSTWAWGHARKPHVLLLMYASSEAALTGLLEAQRAAIAGALVVTDVKETRTLPDEREHFGWRDGISTPLMEGLDGKPLAEVSPRGVQENAWTYPYRAGEFILGYKNEYEAYTESPTIAPGDDADDLLPRARDGARKDLGRNGTYLVYREMTQDVARFWDYLAERTREPGVDEVARAVALGAKMVGRWPPGAPLATSPLADDLDQANDNGFTYAADPAGLRCPVGAHIRRANPRDHLGDRDRGDAIDMVRKHQMLRRGRSFGAPLVASMDPRDVLGDAARSPEPRGLHFICLVGHIGRQFELVQRAWINSPNFQALFKDADPLLGVHRADGANPSDEFTCPATPVRRKYKQLPQFTRLVGGAYFFLPSLTALRFIARGSRA